MCRSSFKTINGANHRRRDLYSECHFTGPKSSQIKKKSTMFALLLAANSGRISFGETYSVSSDVLGPAKEDVDGSLVYSKTEKEVSHAINIRNKLVYDRQE